MSAFTEPVTAEELIAQFTGVEHEDGGWITRPVHSANLAWAICRLLGPASIDKLRVSLYGSAAPEMLDHDALTAISDGFASWKAATAKVGL